MNVKFCSSCGNKFEYKYSPPKFCSNCGEPVGSVSKKSEASAPVRTKAAPINRLSDDETDAEFVPSIKKLDFEIEDYSQAMSIGDLFGKPTPKNRRSRPQNLEDFLDGKR